MREVKFRAWITEDHEHFETENEKPYMEHGFAFEDYMTINEELAAMQEHGSILMQYTGLKDEKGIDVFEKDIVNIVELGKNILEYVSVVEYENSGYLVTEPNGTQVPLDCFHNQENAVMPLFEIEVIGNAFENPDLLEGEK